MVKIKIAEMIKSFRHSNSLTQDEFAALCGVSPQAVSKWEREVCYPDITTLPSLAQILGCDITDFFE